MTPRGRYAPSPTGELHLGNGSTALLAWLSVRARGGTFVMRMEDLDRGRFRPEYPRQQLDDLAWLGLDWDEGPDLGGPNAPYDQWSRRERYDAALDRLRRSGKAYACFCSRKDIVAAANAPQTPGEELRYPGTCRELSAGEVERRIAEGARPAWRFRVDPEARPRFEDLVRGGVGRDELQAPGDFVLQRAVGEPAYHLAVVVDDAAMGITEVVRGGDLLDSTLRQLLLFEALGAEAPAFGHVPMLLGPDGVRLSKRHAGTALRELREAGHAAEQVVGWTAHLVGLQAAPEPIRAGELVESFSWSHLRKIATEIRVDVETWGGATS